MSRTLYLQRFYELWLLWFFLSMISEGRGAFSVGGGWHSALGFGDLSLN